MTFTRRTPVLLLGFLIAAAPAHAQRGPAPVPTHLDAEVLALACAPVMTSEAPGVPLRITGGQDSFARRIYHPGDLITINGGTENGVEVGQEYYARRVQTDDGASPTRHKPGVIRTSGWIRVYAVDTNMSLATITHACDTVEVNDYLEPFALPVVPQISTARPKPERGNYGRVLLGTDRRTTFGKGDYFIVDRGSDHGVTPGAQFVIYRDRHVDQNFLYELGEAVAVDVKAETSTLKVTLSRDAFAAGDYVAIRR